MNGRGEQGRKAKRGGKDRDGSRFALLPHCVLESRAYLNLSHTARSLLMEVAMQLLPDNNGRLLLSRAHLAPRGWKSADVIQRAKLELLNSGFIFETVKGHRPNKASWYAVTWRSLERRADYDPGALGGFPRSAYLLVGVDENAALCPSHGTGKRPTAPPHGTRARFTAPSHGAMEAISAPSSVPSHGHHLEMPSAGIREGKPGRSKGVTGTSASTPATCMQ
ncbi:hypothetical protein [Azohydromonas lata]|uniref:Helix-turn-helix domain-containing protein n=1 Tax=Azohydromonas lata TaxID=45677 RepID=A0ABU5IFI4_9BURK|nr:hypothetical protein [Azohydromonas lata]MDZ5457887.1 hypothetical protein [Azohydromonas lata]